MTRRLYILFITLLCLPLAAQRSDFMRKEALMPLVERLTAFGRTIPQEKVYVHMDNTCYFQGDTIWFAAYTRQTLPEVPTDYRRTLYWNPNLKLDAEGRARVTLYNNSRTTQIQVEAAGQAADGTLLWNR